jgi:hypothetical protein
LAKASSGQSTNILELQNTAGVTVAGVDASGNPVGGLAHPANFKNLIINGAMQVAQRSTSVASITADSLATADRWTSQIGTIGTWTNSVENDAPTGSGFRKSWKWLCTTADASPAAGDFMVPQTRLEGQNLQHILKGTSSAKELTVSFWVKANVTGTYIVGLFDVDNTRIVSKSYTINASATWEKKTITFPADTTGAFDNDNARSLDIQFWLGAGTNFTSGTLATTWQSNTSANRAVGQTNLASATNNYWQVTGVQLEVGNTATEFEFLPVQQELLMCQRYTWIIRDANNINNGFFDCLAGGTVDSTANARFAVQHPVQMRTAPSLVAPTATASNYAVLTSSGSSACTAIPNIERNSETHTLINGARTGLSTNQQAFLRSNGIVAAFSNYLFLFSAEL